MFSFFNKFIFNQNNENKWLEWIEWQKNQNYFHYQNFNYIENYYNENKILKNFCLNINRENETNIYFSYCFGDFFPLVLLSNEKIDRYEFIKIILEIYDYCKGYTRTMIGDSNIMIKLRNCLNERDTRPIQEIDYEPFLYPYGTIHAHTVAYFSISTLLIRILINFMSYKDIYIIKKYPCQIAYEEARYGCYRTIKTLNEFKKTKPKCITCFSEINHNDLNSLECLKCKGLESQIPEVSSYDSYLKNRIYYDDD